MTKKKDKPGKWWLITTIAVVAGGIILAFSFLNSLGSKYGSGYKKYTNSTYGFSVEYPAGWEVKNDTHVFENGDIVAFQVKGPTQKRYTEFIDGARFIVSKPFTIPTDLKTWMKGYFNNQAKFSQFTLASNPFEEVEDCSNFGCMRYLFTTINNDVYGIALFAQGTTRETAAYENTLLYMIQSLTFDNTQNKETLSKEDAAEKVKALPEVIDYLKRVPNGLILVNGEEDDSYLIQVYEFKNDHTATFNWYDVDKTTGKIEKQF